MLNNKIPSWSIRFQLQKQQDSQTSGPGENLKGCVCQATKNDNQTSSQLTSRHKGSLSYKYIIY